jgi:RNase P subunit RPR2
LIADFMTSGTFVICADCGSTIWAGDPESMVQIEEKYVLLRCTNNCCGNVSRYSAVDFAKSQGATVDYSSKLLAES